MSNSNNQHLPTPPSGMSSARGPRGAPRPGLGKGSPRGLPREEPNDQPSNPNIGAMLAARGAPRPDMGAMLAARGPPRPDMGAMLAARGAPRPDMGAMLAARGAPRPDMGAMLAARGAPRPDMGAMLAARGPPASTSEGETGPNLHAMRLGLVAAGRKPSPFGGGGLGGLGGLKKAKPKTPQQLPLGEGIPSNEEGQASTPTDRLRVCDSLRMHVPLPEEREKLKLGGGDRDRIPVGPDTKALLLFCGASRGVRFTSDDLSSLSKAAKLAEDKFSTLDANYKTLSAQAKKKKLLTPEELKGFEQYLLKVDQTNSEMDFDLSSLSEGLKSSQEAKGGNESPSLSTKQDDSFDYGEFGGDDDGAYMAPLASSVLKPDDNTSNITDSVPLGVDININHVNTKEVDPILEEVFQFHICADQYLNAYRGLVVDIIKRKQSEINEDGEEISVDKDHGEGLKSAKPLPEYLSLLLEKYSKEANSVKSTSGALCDSLAHLSAFLTACLFAHISTTSHELEALRELSEASADGVGGLTNQLPCFSTRHNDENTHSSSSLTNTELKSDGLKTRRYWTRRLWTFLSKVRELKSVPKQEKKLDDKSLYLMWVQQ